MVYKINQNFWSLGGKYHITDIEDVPRFFVKGEAFSWGDNLSFQDMLGNEQAIIKQELFNFQPKYEILIKNESIAYLIKEFSWIGMKFTLDIPGPNDYTIEGSFWCHEFIFKQHGEIVAKVSKETWTWDNSYGVEIYNENNIIEILCTSIIINRIVQKSSS